MLAAVVLVVLWKRDVIRPGSFAGAGRVREIGSPWFVWVVAAIVVFMAAQMGSALAIALAGRSPAGAEASVASMPLRSLAIVSLGSYAVGIAAAMVMGRLLARTAEGFGVKARHFAVGAGCFVLAYPVVFAVSSVSVAIAGLLREGEPPRVAHESLRQIIDHSGDHWAWVLAGTAIIGAPIVEEMIYRVFLQTGLLRAWRSPWLAIWATAALFAAAHISVVEPYALPTLFVLGAAMGLAYERTKSPIVPIVMHVLFNGLNVAMAMWLDGS